MGKATEAIKNDQIGRLGSPLAANRERGVVYNDTARAGDVNIPLADQRPGLTGAPQGTLGRDYNTFIAECKICQFKIVLRSYNAPGAEAPGRYPLC